MENMTTSDNDKPVMAGEPALVMVLPEECVISQVSGIWERYLATADAAGVSELDARGVRLVDMAGLQVVLAMVRDMNRLGREWRWVGRSAPFESSAELAGLLDALVA